MNLTLNNFQAWEHASVQVEGLTVVFGPSNRGKSSFVRALRGVLRNDVGERRIRRGTKEVSVSTAFADTELEVRRTKGGTTYRVGAEEFSKLGGKVPPPVESLNVGSVKVGDYTLDPIFAGQFDGQFLLSSAPAEVTAVLNAFASTDKLDRGRRVLTSRTNDLNAEGKALGALISQIEVDFAGVDTRVTDAAPAMGRVESALAEVKGLQRAASAVKSLQDLWSAQESTKEALTAIGCTEFCLTQAVSGFKVASRSQRASQASANCQRLAREVTQVARLGDTLQTALKAAQEAASATMAIRADVAHQALSKQAAAVTALVPIRQSSAEIEAALSSTRSLQRARRALYDARAQAESLDTLSSLLGAALVSWKARVRVVALARLDVEGPRALAAQIGDLRGGFTDPTRDAAALGIIQNLLELQAQAATFEDVGPELLGLEEERQALNDQLDNRTVTCPKCHYQFNPKEGTHAH